MQSESKRGRSPGRLQIDEHLPIETVDGITFNCVSSNFKCSLILSLGDKVFHLTQLLAQSMDKLPSELMLICRDEIISLHPNSSLASFGLAVGGAYQVLVIRLDVTPT